MKFLLKLMKNVTAAIGFLLICWILVSWADVLLHNVPITGDKAYWKGNIVHFLMSISTQLK